MSDFRGLKLLHHGKNELIFVNNYFLAKDAREFRKYYNEVSPDLNLNVTLVDSNGVEEDADLPIGINFFWPDA